MTSDPRSPPAGSDTDLRLAPVGGAAWLAMWVATSGLDWLLAVVTGLVVVLMVMAGLRRSWLLLAVAIVLGASVVLGLMRADARASGTVAELAQRGGSAQVEVELVSDPRPGRGGREYVSARAEVHRVTTHGAAHRVRSPVVLVVTGEAGQELIGMPVGTRLTTRARAAPPDPGDDIAAVLRTTGPLQVVAEPGFGLRQVERVRAGLREAMSTAPPGQRALVPALVLGDISGVTDELRESFVRTGLTHLTAVSGANLSYLLIFLTVGARALGVRGRWLHVLGVLGVVVFVALCRTEPSVLRAAAMGLVTVAALSVVGGPRRGAPRRGVRHLSLAVLVLVLIDPWLSRSIGFVLSVTASAGIIVWSTRWTDALASWLPRPVAEAVAVPLAAQLATQPVVTAISGEVSLVGLLANAVAGPAVGPATVLGFAAAGVGLLHPAPAGVLGYAAGWCAQWVLWVADLGAGFPGSAVTFPAGVVAVTWLVVLVVVVSPLVGPVLRRRWAVLALAGLMVASVLRGPTPPGWPPGDWVMVACDVGQGDALVLRAGPNQAVVVDTGPDPTAMRTCLTELGVRRVPLLVLSHYHADHIGGLDGLSTMPVGQVLVSPLASPAVDARRVSEAYGDRTRVAVPGVELTIGDVRLSVLGPAAPSEVSVSSDGESSAENDASIGAIAEVGGVRILFTGDLTATGQRRLARAVAGRPVDVVKVAHHGSADFDAGLYRAADASLAVISVGSDNTYGHPAPGLLRELRNHNLAVARTDESGAIAIVREGQRVRVVGRSP